VAREFASPRLSDRGLLRHLREGKSGIRSAGVSKPARFRRNVASATMRAMRAPVLLSALTLFAVASCRLIIDADADELGPPPVACSSGDRLDCVCPTGMAAVQVCNAGGSFDPCPCPPLGGAGMGSNGP
jgi:hypothetical protein